MKDEVKEIIERIVPPPPGLDDDDEDRDGDAEDETIAPSRHAKSRRLARADGAAADAITEEALDEAEEHIDPDEDVRDRTDNLGVFYEKDYAERIAGWEFKEELVYVETATGPIEIEAYFRRPLGSPAGTKWQRIGHERSADALDIRRLIHCAELREERAEEARERRALIESLFGPGTLPLVEPLLAAREADAEARLTPRQEAFCRHYLTEPSGTRAAIMAGYAESGAGQEAHRLLKNADILQKISALRRAHALSYALDRDTMLDKLEAFFEDAMKGQSYSAALRALLAQGELSGLFNRRHKATERAEARARTTAKIGARPQAPAGVEKSQ